MKKVSYLVAMILIAAVTTVLANPIEQLIAEVVDFNIVVDKKSVSLGNDIVTINDKTYIPLRDIAEVLNNDVDWDENTKTISIESNEDDDELFVFKKGDLYGYMDKYGKVIIEPQFEYAGEFSEGLACVGKSKDRDWGVSILSSMAYGYINTGGELVIPYINERERDFHNGLVCAWELDSDKCYFMNRKGENILKKYYYDMKSFSDGYAAVLLNDTAKNPHRLPAKEPQQWTFIDTKGKECGGIYTDVTSFTDGISVVEQDGVRRAINTSFETVFKSDYILQSYSGGGQYIARDPETNKLGVIDDKNNVIIDFKYKYIYYSDSMYKVGLSDTMYGVINKDGKVMVEPKINQYISGYGYVGGMVVIGDEHQVIDREGNVILTLPEYDSVVPCAKNLLHVYKEENGKRYAGYIDKYGNVLMMNEVSYKNTGV